MHCCFFTAASFRQQLLRRCQWFHSYIKTLPLKLLIFLLFWLMPWCPLQPPVSLSFQTPSPPEVFWKVSINQWISIGRLGLRSSSDNVWTPGVPLQKRIKKVYSQKKFFFPLRKRGEWMLCLAGRREEIMAWVVSSWLVKTDLKKGKLPFSNCSTQKRRLAF